MSEGGGKSKNACACAVALYLHNTVVVVFCVYLAVLLVYCLLFVIVTRLGHISK